MANPTNLTEIQTSLLRLGAAAPDGAIDLSQIKDRPKAALSGALGALKRKGLAAKSQDGHWQITPAGRGASGVPASGAAAHPAEDKRPPRKMPAGGQATTRRGQLLALLQRKTGASMAEMQQVTGWQPHSVRALLSGLRKDGMTVTCAKHEKGPNRYHAASVGAE